MFFKILTRKIPLLLAAILSKLQVIKNQRMTEAGCAERRVLNNFQFSSSQFRELGVKSKQYLAEKFV